MGETPQEPLDSLRTQADPPPEYRDTHCLECFREFDAKNYGFRYNPPGRSHYYVCEVCHTTGMSRIVDALEASCGARNDSPTIHEAVADFAVHMIHKLLLNRHKPHWSKYTSKQLFERVKQECCELLLAIEEDDRKSIVREAADVANFCLFLADNASKAGVPCEQTVNGGSSDAVVEASPSDWCVGDVIREVNVGGDMGLTQRLIKGEPGTNNFWICSCGQYGCNHAKEAMCEYGTADIPR